MFAKVWRLRVFVKRIFRGRVRRSGRRPFAVYVLPSLSYHLYEFQKYRVHVSRTQPRHLGFNHWKHSPTRNRIMSRVYSFAIITRICTWPRCVCESRKYCRREIYADKRYVTNVTYSTGRCVFKLFVYSAAFYRCLYSNITRILFKTARNAGRGL